MQCTGSRQSRASPGTPLGHLWGTEKKDRSLHLSKETGHICKSDNSKHQVIHNCSIVWCPLETPYGFGEREDFQEDLKEHSGLRQTMRMEETLVNIQGVFR